MFFHRMTQLTAAVAALGVGVACGSAASNPGDMPAQQIPGGPNAGAGGGDALGGAGAPPGGGMGSVGQPVGNAPYVIGPDGTVTHAVTGAVLCVPVTAGACDAFLPGGYSIGYHDVGRLTRTMYNNTVRDLLGTTLQPGNEFPVDEQTLGFDNIAAGLNVQPEHIEAYYPAAEQLIAELFARAPGDAARDRILTCDVAGGGAACQTQILVGFASRAWRRPVTDADLSGYLPLLALTDGLQAAMTAVLLSPRFMYLVETDAAAGVHPLTDYELATRLSYFLWNTMPDDALTQAAAAGLNTDAALSAQLDRMLTAPQRAEFIAQFATQWLNVNKVRSSLPEPTVYPGFDLALRGQMVTETQAVLAAFFDEDRPAQQLLTADFTFLSGPLAAHYGVPGVTGDQVQRVQLDPTMNRLGILTHGSFLVGSSNPTRTSPVKRGLHVLDRVLCSPLPAPPPDIPTIDEGSGLENLSLRERLALHQQKGPACANCHKVMDAIGIGLENFDGVGAYRTADEWGAIDPSGELEGTAGDKTPFAGVSELAAILSADPRVNGCVTEKVLTYGLRRSVAVDRGMRQVLTALSVAEGGSLTDTIRTVVMSDVFRNRQAAAEGQ